MRNTQLRFDVQHAGQCTRFKAAVVRTGAAVCSSRRRAAYEGGGMAGLCCVPTIS